jgi:hypothetical protein
MNTLARPVKTVPVKGGEIADIWRAMLATPMSTIPRMITGSDRWPHDHRERIKRAIRARWKRSGVGFQLHLVRGPFLCFWWSPCKEESDPQFGHIFVEWRKKWPQYRDHALRMVRGYQRKPQTEGAMTGRE